MPWVVLQMCMTSSQASTVLIRVLIFSSRLPLPRALLTALAGRDSSTTGVAISVTFR